MKRNLDAMRDSAFDLLILGGGITGAGVALDAVLRGLRVALIEKSDFAAGTSSISTKLVHGGLRYLEHWQFALVYEALQERTRLLRNAPHLVHPLRFLIPFHQGARVPGWKWRAGLFAYDVLAGAGNLYRSRSVPREQLLRECPALRSAGLRGGAAYADAQMDDARLCLAVIQTAAANGAVVANYAEAVAFESGGVRVLDRLGGGELRVRGQVVLNATGPWADQVRRLAGENAEPLLAPTKGVHLVAPDRGLRSGLLLLHPDDGRVFFVLPWLGKTLIGTTDTECPESPEPLRVSQEDVAYLLRGYARHLQPALSEGDILSAFVGVRPLLRSRPGEPSARSREDRFQVGPSGLLTVVGGKYTTYRKMAERITDVVMRRLHRSGRCRTRGWRLVGAPAGDWLVYRSEAVAALRSRFALTEEAAGHLVDRYGTLAGEVVSAAPHLAQAVVDGEPDLRCEWVYQREHEMACRAEDHLLRRSRLGLFRPELLRGVGWIGD